MAVPVTLVMLVPGFGLSTVVPGEIAILGNLAGLLIVNPAAAALMFAAPHRGFRLRLVCD